jgi:SAM-dependent methyltransferase
VESWRQLLLESHEQLQRTELPKRIIRHLIFSHQLSVGDRVLDAGCGSGELAQYFASLGFNVTGLDESPETIADAHEAAPEIDFYCGRLSENISCPEHEFDLVMVRDPVSFRQSLFTRAALWTTANLLSCVRPQGMLVILPKWNTLPDAKSSVHSLSCYEKLLSCFGGSPVTSKFESGRMHGSIAKFFGGPIFSGYATIVVRVPEQQIPRSDWLQVAQTLSNEYTEACCQQASEVSSEHFERRRAA